MQPLISLFLERFPGLHLSFICKSKHVKSLYHHKQRTRYHESITPIDLFVMFDFYICPVNCKMSLPISSRLCTEMMKKPTIARGM